jgi:hypothetical protein
LEDHRANIELNLEYPNIRFGQEPKVQLVKLGLMYALEGRFLPQLKPSNEVARVMPLQVEEEELPEIQRHVDEPVPVPQPEPILPSEAERQTHNLVHVPYAPWCDVCTRCKATDDPHGQLSHARGGQLEEEVPITQIDFMFIGSLTVLTCYVVDTNAGAATGIQDKGGDISYAVAWLVRTLNKLGVTRRILQTDQEPSIEAIATKAAQQREHSTMLRTSPRRSHQSIGAVERWHRSVQEQFRAVKLQAETSLGHTIKDGQPLCAWILRHAAWLLHRFQVTRSQGTTAFARTTGRNYSGRVAEFVEQVLALQPQPVHGRGPRVGSKFQTR